jgi:peptidoglycan hydrolase CwlO-like protein
VDWTSFLTPTIGATGLLALAVILILRGSLVPRRTVDQMRADKDSQIAIWKDAYATSQRAVEMKDRQIDTLLEAARTTTHVVTAVSEAAGLNSGRSHRALAPSEGD